jgi:hypothetical protein
MLFLTKVQKMLNSLQTSQIFAVMFPVTSTSSGTRGIQFFSKSPLFHFHGNCGKVCPTDSDFFWLISFH